MRDLDRLVRDLGKVAASTLPAVAAVVERAAVNVKNGMAADASGIRHAPHFPRSITYSRRGGVGWLGAEIGPDKSRRQGALGNILAFGTSRNGPVFSLTAALDREAPKFEAHLGDAAAKALLP